MRHYLSYPSRAARSSSVRAGFTRSVGSVAMCASPTPRQIAQTTVWRTAPSLRRSVCLFTILASAVAACGSSKVKELEAQNEDLQEQIGSLKAKLEEVDGHVTELESAQSDLTDAVGRFELE